MSEFACPRCALVLPALSYCPRCRAQARGEAYDPDAVDRLERSYVITLVALSLGALGVPRLWRSKAFGTGGKLFWSAIGFGNTAGVFVLLYLFGAYWLPALLRPIREAMGR
ncbi:MAG: hypothetical protein KDD82_01195 [Planctomycetes bacterium]|nr:hypothetical protein [Planctomycetota bacterium]